MRTDFTAKLQFSWIAAAVTVVGAGVSIYKGIKQKSDAKKLLAQTQGKEVPQALLDNQRLATQQANEGMPSEQYAVARRNIDRQNNLAIMRSNSRRGGLGLIGQIQQGTNDAYGNLDARSAAMKVNNQGRLMAVNSQIGGFQNQKYHGDYNYARSLQGAGNENINNGIDSGLSAIGSGASGYMKRRSSNNGLYGGGGYSGGITSYSGGID